MSVLKYRRASGVLHWYLNRIGMEAIVMPNGVCYYTKPLPRYIKRHESVHWQQYQNHGRLWFVLLYLFESVVKSVKYRSLAKGYIHNKYEIEARSAEAE